MTASIGCAQVTKLQLYKIYGKSGEGKKFVEELCKGLLAGRSFIPRLFPIRTGRDSPSPGSWTEDV